MRSILSVTLCVFATGCLSGPSGVWMIQYTPTVTDEDPCATVGTENFEEAAFPEADVGTVEGDWEYTQTETFSDVLMFVQIETTAAGEAVLLVDTSAYPGTSDGGTWTFSWDATEVTTEAATHTDGYVYNATSSGSSTTTFTIEPKGSTASGSVTASLVQESVWTESDEWDPDQNDLGEGEIPASSYLETEGGLPPRNLPDEDECAGETCQIALTTECSGSQSFTATKTDFSDEDAYQYLMSSGQGDGNL